MKYCRFGRSLTVVMGVVLLLSLSIQSGSSQTQLKSPALRRQVAKALSDLFRSEGVHITSECRGQVADTLVFISAELLSEELEKQVYESIKTKSEEAGFTIIVFENSRGQRVSYSVETANLIQNDSQGGVVLSTPEKSLLGNTYIKGSRIPVALFKPVEIDPETAKAYASAPLSISQTQIVHLDASSMRTDSLLVTIEFIGQERYAGGLLDMTGEVRLRITIENHSKSKLRVIWSESNVVDNSGTQWGLNFPTSSPQTIIRSYANYTTDLSSIMRDRLGSTLALCTGFTLYVETTVGDQETTILQRFDRIPWSLSELDKL